MFKIPLQLISTASFPDHGIRFGCVQGFYVSMDGTNEVYEATNYNHRSDEDESTESETFEYETTSESESGCCCFINFKT